MFSEFHEISFRLNDANTRYILYLYPQNFKAVVSIFAKNYKPNRFRGIQNHGTEI